eukprot:CAMPEP_0174905416 /NCGR_PEP_ID=MMETSP0167-20121228/52914_1 /TAXON_ID=38298 /ORGANISM="Rhodella maculata, Strain CCMP736" /LENGTH=152 /DNA_ID=CAMNT_0016148349 /DNA_START=69 /DNA_END=524 /DNA_ORIENTATION=-
MTFSSTTDSAVAVGGASATRSAPPTATATRSTSTILPAPQNQPPPSFFPSSGCSRPPSYHLPSTRPSRCRRPAARPPSPHVPSNPPDGDTRGGGDCTEVGVARPGGDAVSDGVPHAGICGFGSTDGRMCGGATSRGGNGETPAQVVGDSPRR